MLTLESPIQYIKGVGPKMAAKLGKLGVTTAGDLLFYYPRSWIDFSNPQAISSTRIGQEVVVRVRIIEVKQEYSFKKKISIIRALARDTSGEINLVWFNQPYLINTIKPEQELIVSGKVAYDFKEKTKILLPTFYDNEAKILPIYPETAGITSKYLRKIIKYLLDLELLEEFLPKDILLNQKLIDLKTAIREIHFPSTKMSLETAKNRLAFNELFLIILKMLLIKKNILQNQAIANKINVPIIQKLINNLPFKLTNAQRRVSWEILRDLSKSVPMNRLLQGDVGSGKTIVAIIAALEVIKNNHQVVWMAPTEILAQQHFKSACNVLTAFNISVSLLTSSQIKCTKHFGKNKTKLQQKQFALEADLIIGTHSLIQKNIGFKKLNFVIIDEQHRFGVKQRAILLSKNYRKTIPHFLSMTATPIPRTLALTIYGDLDISILNEMPKNRQKIITKLVDPINRDKAYDFIHQQIKIGRQAFVICPLIEEKSKNKEAKNNLFDIEKKSVVAEYKKLSEQIFPNLKIAMLHGKIKPKDKEKIMNDFRKGKFNIIVSTSVVEVGIDIPNATVMLIEDADRFGLSQLHQFRGRVGRGEHQSYCLLFTSSLNSETTRRLKYMVEYNDGYKLAEKDLEIRGPGQLSGDIQHGLPDLKIASLTDTILIERARTEAEKIAVSDLHKFPDLKNQLEKMASNNHLE